MSRAALLDQLVQEAGRAHERLQVANQAVEAIRGRPPGVGDLWVIPDAPGPAAVVAGLVAGGTADVEWAVLEAGGHGRLRLVPADASPLEGSADISAPDGRVLRCALAAWLDPAALAGGRRSGVLDAATIAAARERCEALAEGKGEVSLQALEVDRDPEYRQLIRVLGRASRMLERSHSGVTGAPLAPAVEHRRELRWRWKPSATLAATLLLVMALVGVVVQQGRTIDELRRGGPTPIVDSPVVWLEPMGERGPSEMETLPEETRFVLLLMRPESSGPRPEVFRLEIFAGGQDEEALWSGEWQPGEIPELFVLVPGHLLAVGEYRLELTGRRKGEEIPAGRFGLQVTRRR